MMAPFWLSASDVKSRGVKQARAQSQHYSHGHTTNVTTIQSTYHADIMLGVFVLCSMRRCHCQNLMLMVGLRLSIFCGNLTFLREPSAPFLRRGRNVVLTLDSKRSRRQQSIQNPNGNNNNQNIILCISPRSGRWNNIYEFRVGCGWC